MIAQKMTYLDQASVDSQNLDHYCGFTDWQVGVAKDVTGRDCEGSTFVANTPAPDLVAVDAQGRLRVGLVAETGSTLTSRPAAFDSCYIYYRPGHVPPGGGGSACNSTTPDPLPGIYQVTSHQENTQSCGDLGTAAGGSGYAIIYANTSVIAGAPGWSLVLCDSPAACQAVDRQFLLATQWPIGELTSENHWAGRSSGDVFLGQCQATVTLAAVERRDDGALRIQHKVYKGTIASATTGDACGTASDDVDPVAAGFSCQSAGELDLMPVMTH
jgi:hypothetical protein